MAHQEIDSTKRVQACEIYIFGERNLNKYLRKSMTNCG